MQISENVILQRLAFWNILCSKICIYLLLVVFLVLRGNLVLHCRRKNIYVSTPPVEQWPHVLFSFSCQDFLCLSFLIVSLWSLSLYLVGISLCFLTVTVATFCQIIVPSKGQMTVWSTFSFIFPLIQICLFTLRYNLTYSDGFLESSVVVRLVRVCITAWKEGWG